MHVDSMSLCQEIEIVKCQPPNINHSCPSRIVGAHLCLFKVL